MMTDREMATAIGALWRRNVTWRRLEASATDTATAGAYCCPVKGRSELTGAMRLNGLHGPVRELARLLDESGWSRIEILGWPGRAPDGWCERADGSGISISSMDGYEDTHWGRPWCPAGTVPARQPKRRWVPGWVMKRKISG